MMKITKLFIIQNILEKFSGIFLHFRILEGFYPSAKSEFANIVGNTFSILESQYRAKILTSQKGSECFVAVHLNENFFESHTRRSIRKLLSDIQFLKAIIESFKLTVDKLLEVEGITAEA